MIPSKKDKMRFWEKVNTSGRCWDWTACKNGYGYGQFRINGKTVNAHRISYSLLHGIIPEGLFICHHCDNPSCVKPSHLFIGTNSDNLRDSVAKGRNNPRKGEKNGRSKLVDKDIHEIRRLYSLGVSPNLLSKIWSVTKENINHIANRRSWDHI